MQGAEGEVREGEGGEEEDLGVEVGAEGEDSEGSWFSSGMRRRVELSRTLTRAVGRRMRFGQQQYEISVSGSRSRTKLACRQYLPRFVIVRSWPAAIIRGACTSASTPALQGKMCPLCSRWIPVACAQFKPNQILSLARDSVAAIDHLKI